MAKTGRPSKYDGLNLQKVQALASKGWTDAEMAEFFEVDTATWHRWKEKHPDFCDSLKDWKTEADSRVERSLFERATGYSHRETKMFQYEGNIISEDTVKHYPPDTTAAIFWLKNRRPKEWKDKQEFDLGNEPIKVTVTRKVVTGGART